MFKRKNIIYFLIIVAVSVTSLVVYKFNIIKKSTTSVNMENIKLLRCITIHHDLWGNVNIDNNTDLNNISVFLSKLNYSTTKFSNDNQSIITGELNFGSSIENFSLYHSYIVIDNKTYYGTEIEYISRIINTYLYNNTNIMNLFKNSNSIIVNSLDIDNYSHELNQEQKNNILSIFENYKVVYNDSDVIIMRNADYPNIEVTLKSNNQKVIIRFFNKDFLQVQDEMQNVINFRTTSNLYQELLSIIKLPDLTPDKTSYLFKSTNLIMVSNGSNQKDLSPIRNEVVRALLGIYKYGGNNVVINNNDPINLIFTVENHKINVLVYDDYYIYNGKRINLKDVKKAFISVYNAN